MPSTLLRKTSKVLVAPAGIVTRRRPGDVVILLYHRVGNGGAEIELPANAFEDHLRYLSGHERVLSLDDALRGDREGGVVVTFDDGTPDFHDTVLPLLRRYNVPATLYLATASVGEREGLEWLQLLDAVGSGLVTVGSHTHTHADLRRVDERTCEEELRRSKDLIEDHLDRPCQHFAYPRSVGSRASEQIVRRLFRSAALDAWRTNRRDAIDRYRLGRTPVLRSDGATFFRAKVHGLLDGEAALYRAFGRGPWRSP